MCGIAGIWQKNNSQVSLQVINKLISKLEHRGPDAKGVWITKGLALANSRLKILDLSDAGNQPFTDGQDVLVFNGRIFNYLDLKKELSARFRFKTTCDTEVLFRALQVWNEKALDKIEGQFTFAFYNKSQATLLVARDHVGICPLYIKETDDAFYFASEIKPLLSLGKCSLDKQAVVDYFSYRYNIQNQRTLFKEIKRFPPAHYLKIDLQSGRKLTRRYWRLKFKSRQYSKIEGQKQFNKIIDKEIEKQKTVDVPVGIFLSGGIDSGALLQGFSKTKTKINSFTIKFSNDTTDYQRVEKLSKKINFNKNIIDFNEGLLDSIEKVIEALEEPFGDLIIVANYYLAKHASKDLKVVLSGEGGDEALSGYDHQRAYLKMLKLSKLALTDKLLSLAFKILPSSLFGLIQSYPGKFSSSELKRISQVYKDIKNPAKAYLQLIRLFNDKELNKLFSARFKDKALIKPDTKPIEEIFNHDKKTWQAVMRSEIEQLTLIINLLKQDRFSMHFSMESCVPLVSRPILDFVGTLPYDIINSKINKELFLKYSNQDIIKKKPFSLFSNKTYLDKLISLFDEYINYNSIKENDILSWPEVEKIKTDLEKGNILVVKKAMAILVFTVWLKVFKKYLRG